MAEKAMNILDQPCQIPSNLPGCPAKENLRRVLKPFRHQELGSKPVDDATFIGVSRAFAYTDQDDRELRKVATLKAVKDMFCK